MKHLLSAFGVLALGLCLGTLPTFAQGSPGHSGAAPGKTHGPSSRTDKHDTTTSGKKTADQLLTQNTQLAKKLQSLLPKGTNVHTFCSGLKNLGQCVAAVHVAHNLGFTPAQLRQLHDKLVAGTSLGKAVHQINPTVNAKAETKKGTRQAKDDLKETSS